MRIQKMPTQLDLELSSGINRTEIRIYNVGKTCFGIGCKMIFLMKQRCYKLVIAEEGLPQKLTLL